MRRSRRSGLTSEEWAELLIRVVVPALLGGIGGLLAVLYLLS